MLDKLCEVLMIQWWIDIIPHQPQVGTRGARKSVRCVAPPKVTESWLGNVDTLTNVVGNVDTLTNVV